MKAVEDFISFKTGAQRFSQGTQSLELPSKPKYWFLRGIYILTSFIIDHGISCYGCSNSQKNLFVRTCVDFCLQFTAALCAISLAYYAVGQTSCPYFRTAQLFRIWWHHPLTKNQPTAILLFQMRNSACWTSANSSVKLVRSVVLLSRARAPLQWPSNLSLQQQQQSWPAAAKQQQLHCSAAPVVRCSSSSSGGRTRHRSACYETRAAERSHADLASTAAR